MAYICEKERKCKGCEHFRFDEDRQRYACFAQKDEETKRQIRKERKK